MAPSPPADNFLLTPASLKGKTIQAKEAVSPSISFFLSPAPFRRFLFHFQSGEWLSNYLTAWMNSFFRVFAEIARICTFYATPPTQKPFFTFRIYPLAYIFPVFFATESFVQPRLSPLVTLHERLWAPSILQLKTYTFSQGCVEGGCQGWWWRALLGVHVPPLSSGGPSMQLLCVEMAVC